MKPTLLVGDYIFVSKFSYGFSHHSFPFSPKIFKGRIWGSDPARGDVVVFKFPSNPDLDYIKRIIGLPGDKVQLKDSVVYINGTPVNRKPDGIFTDDERMVTVPKFVETLDTKKTYDTLDTSPGSLADTTNVFEVPEGHYFFLGDNRDNSSDSRFEVGMVPAENLVGKAQVIFLSFKDRTPALAILELASGHALEPPVYRLVIMPAAKVSAQKIATLEDRIGHHFKTHERLVRALTHSSASKQAGEISHYERLEFLGDRVLGLCVAEMLFSAFPKAREGELSVRLNTLVSGNACAQVADEIGLHGFIYAGADVKHIAGKRMKSVRADVVESLIAAIYLDGGLEAAKSFVEKFWGERIHEAGAAISDSKTALQEWAHVKTNGTPVYTVTSRSGPDHDPVFVIKVEVDGIKSATGTGRSKRAAEQAAAEAILLREKAWVKTADGTIEENPV